VRRVEAGVGEPAVVLEAGAGNGAEAWQRVIPLLAPHVRVVAYDRAGLGGSGPAPGLATIDRMIDDLASVITGLGASPCVLADCPCWSWYSAACRAAFRSASSPPSCASSPTRIPHPMPNELGVHNLTFEVDALQAILELAADRCHLVGGVGQYEAIWRMAAVRGPQGLSVNLARRIN
jgi:pimeloyl-ACP methyl ester carboxylesterase